MIEKQTDIEMLKRDAKYKKLYYWGVSKMSIMKPLYWTLALVVVISMYGLFAAWRDGMPLTLPVVVYFGGFPLIAVGFVVFGMPRMVFKRNLQRRQEVFGDVYRIMTNSNGVSINGKVIPWDGKYRRWEGKYGIAMINGSHIISLFPKHLYSEEEYKQLKEWLQLS